MTEWILILYVMRGNVAVAIDHIPGFATITECNEVGARVAEFAAYESANKIKVLCVQRTVSSK